MNASTIREVNIWQASSKLMFPCNWQELFSQSDDWAATSKYQWPGRDEYILYREASSIKLPQYLSKKQRQLMCHTGEATQSHISGTYKILKGRYSTLHLAKLFCNNKHDHTGISVHRDHTTSTSDFGHFLLPKVSTEPS